MTAPHIFDAAGAPRQKAPERVRSRRRSYGVFTAGFLLAALVGASLYAVRLYPQRTAKTTARPPLGALVTAPQQRRSTAARTVKTLWRFEQAGALPAVPTLYDPRIVAAIGEKKLLAALSIYQPNFAGWAVAFAPPEASSLGKVVIATVTDVTGKANHYSYIVIRRGRDWVVAYDSMLTGALTQAAQSAVQNTIDPYAARLSPRAIRAGIAAQHAYLSIVMAILGGTTRAA